ncbi:RecB family exonuclease [Candidatus Undinarchaeota archaeon]
MPRYSHSKIETYENCPLQFKFNYIDRVETETSDSVEAFLGSRVHDTLEKLYKDLMLEKLNSVDDLVKHYENEWDKNWNENILIVKKEYTAQNYKDTGARHIRDYYKSHEPFDDGKTLGLEKNVRMVLDEDKDYRVTGYIDRLVQTGPGKYEVHDYKTGAFLPEQEKLDQDRQLALYALVIREKFDDVKETDLIWHYTAFDKDLRSTRTPEQLKDLKKDIVARIDVIETAIKNDDFPAKESGLCNWCSYQPHCPKRKHAYKTADMPANQYLKEPGVKLANMYAENEYEKAEFMNKYDAKKEELKEALIEYAKNEEVEEICGSDCKLRVKHFEKASYPKANSEEREALEKILKGAGVWDEISSLSLSSLDKLVNSSQFNEKLTKEVKKFEEMVDGWRISKSKLR